MILSYHGAGAIKASYGDLTLAFNPVGKDAPIKGARFGADIVLVSWNDALYNGIDQTTYGEKTPFVVEGPGEYEASGIFIRGLETEGPNGTVNTIFVLKLEEMTMVHLGALGTVALKPEVLETLAEVDILLLPVFDSRSVAPGEMHKLATRLNPKVIVPLYARSEKESTLTEYLKEAGEEKGEMLDKFTFKRKDIAEHEGEVVLLKAL